MFQPWLVYNSLTNLASCTCHYVPCACSSADPLHHARNELDLVHQSSVDGCGVLLAGVPLVVVLTSTLAAVTRRIQYARGHREYHCLSSRYTHWDRSPRPATCEWQNTFECERARRRNGRHLGGRSIRVRGACSWLKKTVAGIQALQRILQSRLRRCPPSRWYSQGKSLCRPRCHWYMTECEWADHTCSARCQDGRRTRAQNVYT
jgi:hypothetical protein